MSGSYPDENREILFFQSNYFTQSKKLFLRGKSIRAMDKERLRITLDPEKERILVGSPDLVLDQVIKNPSEKKKELIFSLKTNPLYDMLNMGFIEQIETIIANLSHERVTVLLSATMPQDITVLCSKIMRNPIRVEIEEQNSVADRIAQERYLVDQTDKMKLLRDLTMV